MCENCKDTTNNIDTSKRGTIKQLFFGLMALPFLGFFGKKAEAGYGCCRVCNCDRFEGYGGATGDESCENCGHAFRAHGPNPCH